MSKKTTEDGLNSATKSLSKIDEELKKFDVNKIDLSSLNDAIAGINGLGSQNGLADGLNGNVESAIGENFGNKYNPENPKFTEKVKNNRATTNKPTYDQKNKD